MACLRYLIHLVSLIYAPETDECIPLRIPPLNWFIKDASHVRRSLFLYRSDPRPHALLKSICVISNLVKGKGSAWRLDHTLPSDWHFHPFLLSYTCRFQKRYSIRYTGNFVLVTCGAVNTEAFSNWIQGDPIAVGSPFYSRLLQYLFLFI